VTDYDLRVIAGRSIQQWAVELSKHLSVDDAWRLMLGGAIAVMQAELNSSQMADTFRQLASMIDEGATAPEKLN